MKKPIELLDFVDENDQVIRQESRSDVHRYGYLHRGVHIFLITKDRQLLVQQRSSNQDAFPLALDCSVSEHVQAGEDYHQAAIRGLQEELGIFGIKLFPLVKFQMRYGLNDNEICILYEGKFDNSLVSFDPLEVKRIAYYSLKDLDRLSHSGEFEFSSWFVQLMQWYLDKPSELRVLKTYPHKRLLIPPSP